MNYVELYIPCADAVQAEIWTAELAEFPFESFEQEDTCLKAYIRGDDLGGCREEVDAFLRTLGEKSTFAEIETRNWNALWESNFEPVDVQGRCVIRAPFHPAPGGDTLDVVIMPKMSFGTGHHATTWLMCSEILGLDLEGKEGLDMGSGTGVLAIVAAKLGALHVDAVDIDQWAYENSIENIRDNRVEGIVKPVLGDVSVIRGKKYDFILANINRNIILADMADYVAAMKSGAFIIFSGILEQDIPAIKEAASGNGLTFVSEKSRDGWAALEFAKV